MGGLSPVSEAVEVTASIITPAKQYTTYVTTAALDFSNVSGLKAYVATSTTTTSVTLKEVGAVDTVAAGTERTVFEDPADTLRHRGNGSISASHLEQLQALEIGITGTTEIVGTSTHLSVLEVVETILVVRSPGVLIAIEQ